jgi:hypothetical protein
MLIRIGDHVEQASRTVARARHPWILLGPWSGHAVARHGALRCRVGTGVVAISFMVRVIFRFVQLCGQHHKDPTSASGTGM